MIRCLFIHIFILLELVLGRRFVYDTISWIQRDGVRLSIYFHLHECIMQVHTSLDDQFLHCLYQLRSIQALFSALELA